MFSSLPLIDSADLLKLNESETIILIDARSGKNIRAAYEAEHLDGALFVDLDLQLADVPSDAANGGRHPLPTSEKFGQTIESLGISPESHVIVYDDKNGANAAARFWWMMKALGHEKIQVLNGGMQAAVNEGFPVCSKVHDPVKHGKYPTDHWKLMTADINEVENVAQNQNFLVVDVRENKRFIGETEPIDLIAGHIPGAINVPFSENLDNNGCFLSPAELEEKYRTLFAKRAASSIIFHCGSGVTACHSLLAIAHAGLPIPKLYVGSWSEWSRNDKAIAKDVD